MVDAHADIFVEIAGTVVPPRVPSWFRMMHSVRIDESGARQPRKSLPLALGHVRTTMTGLGVPHIDILGRHVEITADNGRCIGCDGMSDPARQLVEPQEFRFIKRRIY